MSLRITEHIVYDATDDTVDCEIRSCLVFPLLKSIKFAAVQPIDNPIWNAMTGREPLAEASQHAVSDIVERIVAARPLSQ